MMMDDDTLKLLSVPELAVMQHDLKRYPEDANNRKQVMDELKRRQVVMEELKLKFKGPTRPMQLHGLDMYGNKVVEDIEVPLDMWENIFLTPLFAMFDNPVADEGGNVMDLEEGMNPMNVFRIEESYDRRN